MQDSPLSPKLRAHLERVDQALAGAGVEPLVRAGILRDLEGQIAEMRSEEGMDDDAVLAALDPPEVYVESRPAAKPGEPPAAPVAVPATDGPPPAAQPWRPSLVAVAFWAFSLLLAAATVLFEGFTHICALNFFDPMPTWRHFLGLLLIPAVMIVTAYCLRKGATAAALPWLMLANGYVAAVSFGYSLAFLPLLPLSLIAIIYFGLGLLPLSPLFVLASALHQGYALRRRNNSGRRRTGVWRWWLAGLMAAFLVFGFWESRRFLVERAIGQAMEMDPGEREAGMSTLRWLGGEDVVLEFCHWRSGRFSTRATVRRQNPEAYRALYYRLTGRDYREATRPAPRPGLGDGEEEETWRDSMADEQEVGGDAVGSRARDLALNSAAIDVSVAASPDGDDAGPGVAYAEMTFEFRNNSALVREARCQILLPPGGVASRLTLWIDGEEREAAFGRRATVRKAYQEVAVVRRRDPALLTTAGPDRVLLQCFPINPGSAMKVKVGFSLPLLPDGDQAVLQLPRLSERNFALAADKPMALWVESRTPLAANLPALKAETVAESANPRVNEASDGENAGGAGSVPGPRPFHAIRGSITPSDLSTLEIRAAIPAAGGPPYGATLSGLNATGALVEAAPLEKRLVAVVLDCSAACAGIFRSSGAPGEGTDWNAVLDKTPPGVRLALFAGPLSVPPMDRDVARSRWPALLAGLEFVGADEQAGNLEKAWDLCAGERDGMVVWLHGPLPVDIADCSGLEQRLRRRPGLPGNGNPRIASLQLAPGPNRIEEKLSASPGLFRPKVAGGDTPSKRLASLFANLSYPHLARSEFVYRLNPAPEPGTLTGSAHMVRLALAADLAGKAQAAIEPSAIEDEVEKARAMRLVTPFTGAVVLETGQQYQEHGLDPSSDTASVPVIPEPEEWAMLCIAAIVLFALYWRRRSAALISNRWER